MIGRRLLHVEILEKLGEGGMGVVYKARDTHLDRLVAIKVPPPEKVTDPERRSRFVKEAKAASALQHPNIITVHDIVQAEGLDLIVMEHVEGKTLDAMIPRAGMRLSEALKIALQIAQALAAAHGKGIVHRDVKPANVMVGTGGAVKVLDFGLAKLNEPAAAAGASELPTGDARTAAGVILGTPAYMSPEQAEGKPVDARSDIFSFGAVLYEIATGRRAFTGGSWASTISAVLSQEPTPLDGLPPRPREARAAVSAQGPGQALPAHGRRVRGARGTQGGIRIGEAWRPVPRAAAAAAPSPRWCGGGVSRAVR